VAHYPIHHETTVNAARADDVLPIIANAINQDFPFGAAALWAPSDVVTLWVKVNDFGHQSNTRNDFNARMAAVSARFALFTVIAMLPR
jgi:hypothetical protein